MRSAFPIRSNTHQREELSERFFRGALPKDWTCEKPSHDYGVDLRVDLFERGEATGLELLVQLKSSAKATAGDIELVRLRNRTYNHLLEKLQVAMLVKYVAAEDEAYWLLVSDISPPQKGQSSFSVHIPKAKRLSAIDWAAIQTRVRSVTDTELAATRKKAIAERSGGV